MASKFLASKNTLSKTKNTTIWLSSAETMKKLKISSCELMHQRESGKLNFQKKGNSYLYEFIEES